MKLLFPLTAEGGAYFSLKNSEGALIEAGVLNGANTVDFQDGDHGGHLGFPIRTF